MNITLDMYGLGPWSYSKLKCLQKCPLQFYLKYIKKIKTPFVQGEDALIGSAAHRILELFVTGKSLEESFLIAKGDYREKISDELWTEKVEALELSIQEFKNRVNSFHSRTPIKRIYTELRVGVTKEFTPTGFFDDDVFFRGIIDLVLFLENEDAIFIDHKKGGSADFGLKNYNTQLDSQKVLFHFGKQKIKGATAGIHFIEASQIKLGDYHDQDYISDHLRKTMLFYVDSAIANVQEIGYFKHIAGNHCKYCDFAEPCKKKALLEEELNTKELVSLCLKQ